MDWLLLVTLDETAEDASLTRVGLGSISCVAVVLFRMRASGPTLLFIAAQEISIVLNFGLTARRVATVACLRAHYRSLEICQLLNVLQICRFRESRYRFLSVDRLHLLFTPVARIRIVVVSAGRA